MHISDWSSDVCSSDLFCGREPFRIIDTEPPHQLLVANSDLLRSHARLDTLAGGRRQIRRCLERHAARLGTFDDRMGKRMLAPCFDCSDFAEKIRFINATARGHRRSEEHTSELQSLMRISY